MIDNPKFFITSVVGIVIVVVVLVTGFRYLGNNTKDETVKADSKEETTGKPATNNGGVKTPIPSNTSPTNNTGVPVTYDNVITYTDKGFVPSTLEIKAGSALRFINKSGSSMRIASVDTPGVPSAARFAQDKSVGYGGVFDINIPNKGNWLYENINDKTKTGIIVVK